MMQGVDRNTSFCINDLVDKRLREIREFLNDKPPNESLYPSAIDVKIYSDKTFLVKEKWYEGENPHINHYYYNGQEMLYCDEQSGVDLA